MSAPTEAAIRKYVAEALSRNEYGGPLEDGFTQAAAAVSDIWDIDDFRPSEQSELDSIIHKHVEVVRQRAMEDLREAMAAAGIEFAENHPHAPAMEWAR